MLRIDLLPAYVRERRAVKAYLIVAGFVLGGVAGGLVFWHTTRQSFLGVKKAKLELANQKKSVVDGIRKLKTDEDTATQPIKTMAGFFREAKNFGPAIETLLREVSRYSFNRVRIFTINPVEPPATGTDPNAAMGGMGDGAMGGALGGGMDMGMGMGGLGGGGAAPAIGDIKAIALDCWTDDFTNVKRFVANLQRSALFSNVIITVPFQFQNTEGPGSGSQGGGVGGLGAMGGAAGGLGDGSGGTQVSGAAPARLMTSRDGGTFQIVCVLVTPIKGAPVPGQTPPPDASGMGMGAGMAGGMPGGEMGGGAAAPGPAAGDSGGGAASDDGGGASKASKREADAE